MVGVITSTDMPGSMRTPLVVRKYLVVMRYFAIFGCFCLVNAFLVKWSCDTHIYNKEWPYVDVLSWRFIMNSVFNVVGWR